MLDQKIANLREQLAASQQQVQKLAREQKNKLNDAIEKQNETFKEIDPDKPGLQRLQQRIFQDRELNKNSLALDEKADKEIEDELERD